MLHGYGSCKESFYYQIKFLSGYFRTIAPDFAGFGASDAPSTPYSVGDYAAWLKEFILRTGAQNCHVLAHSFGARVALKLFSEEPALADRIVITGGAGLVKPRSAAYIRRVKAYRAVKKFFPALAERAFGSKEYRALPPDMKTSYKLIVNEDLKDCARRVKNPVLLVYGSADKVTPPFEEGETFNKLIRGSRFLVTQGGHFCFSEHPELFNKNILQFYTEK